MLEITAPAGKLTGIVCVAPTAEASGTDTDIVPDEATCVPPVEIKPLFIVLNVTALVAEPLQSTWLSMALT
jgi:hypothetical protein